MKKTRQIGLELLAWGLIFGTAACSKSTPTSSNEPAAQGPKADPAAPAESQSPPAKITPPRIVLETSLGNIILQLDSEKAPRTVDNFLAYVDRGFYDQTIVHQVIRGQGILAGGYSADFQEKTPRAPIYNEAASGLKNLQGTIAMVRRIEDAHSATSQFFINIADNPELDHRDRTPEGFGYCVFGKVEKGMDVVNKIANCQVRDRDGLTDTPEESVIIKTARRLK